MVAFEADRLVLHIPPYVSIHDAELWHAVKLQKDSWLTLPVPSVNRDDRQDPAWHNDEGNCCNDGACERRMADR